MATSVQEEGDEGVVDDGHQEVGVEEGVQVGCELPHLNIVSIDSLYFDVILFIWFNSYDNNSQLCPKLIKKITTQIILQNIFLIWLNMFLISSANCETEKV